MLGVQAWACGLGIVGTVLLAACSAAPGAQTPGVGVTASPAAATRGPTPQPTEPFAIREGSLAPGRYLQAGFPPGVSFVLGTGWRAYFDDKDGAYLGGPQGIEIGINKPPKVNDPTTNQPIDTPADLAAWLAQSTAFSSATTSAISVGGVPATLVDATSKVEKDLLAYASGNFHTVPGARYRFYVFPMEGPDLVFFIAGPGAAFEANLPLMKAIVDSIKVGGG
jgi:hypothetical protein